MNGEETTKINIIVTVCLETLEILKIKESVQEVYIYPPLCNLETGTTITAYSESTNESMKESIMNQKPNNPSVTQRKPNNPSLTQRKPDNPC